jgi:hypothetical protein
VKITIKGVGRNNIDRVSLVTNRSQEVKITIKGVGIPLLVLYFLYKYIKR